MISRRVLLSVAVAFGIGIATNVRAQSYPDKPIKMIVPFPPGGPIDTMARLVGARHVVESRPAGGRREPAGRGLHHRLQGRGRAPTPTATRCCSDRPARSALRPRSTPMPRLDPVKSFAPVASVSLLPHVMVVPASLPAKTVQEFVAYAKANPGKLNYGAGLGTPPHLLGDAVQEQGRHRHHLHSLQGRGAVGDRPAGRADAFHHRRHADPDAADQGRQAPRDRRRAAAALARTCPRCRPWSESGYPDFTIDAWTGVVAPAGTPPQIIEKLNGAINAGLLSPETETAMARFSSITKVGTPEEFAAFIAAEAPRWAAMVKLADAKVE